MDGEHFVKSQRRLARAGKHAKRTPQWSGACSFGMHRACKGGTAYDLGGPEMPDGIKVWLPCECSCHKAAAARASGAQESGDE